MVRKVLSLYKDGTRLTKQSFRDEDEQDLSELKTKKMKRILMSVLGKFVNISWRKKLSQIVMGTR